MSWDDWRTDTAERPAVRVTIPAPDQPLSSEVADQARADDALAAPPAPPVPPQQRRETSYAARFPLYADQSASTPPPATGGTTSSDLDRWIPWAAGVLAALLTLVIIASIIISRGRDDANPGTEPAGPQVSSTPKASSEPSASATTPAPAPTPTELVGAAEITAPQTAAPNQDVNGNPVTYAATNMLDQDPQTAWRMPGDATGAVLTVRLTQPTTLASVGMINGYAKTATLPNGAQRDWYTGNRRVLAVRWAFDDGTVIDQPLTEQRQLQSIELPAVTTQQIQITLLTVSAPGKGPASRNFTAISDVSIVGSPVG